MGAVSERKHRSWTREEKAQFKRWLWEHKDLPLKKMHSVFHAEISPSFGRTFTLGYFSEKVREHMPTSPPVEKTEAVTIVPMPEIRAEFVKISVDVDALAEFCMVSVRAQVVRAIEDGLAQRLSNSIEQMFVAGSVATKS